MSRCLTLDEFEFRERLCQNLGVVGVDIITSEALRYLFCKESSESGVPDVLKRMTMEDLVLRYDQF